MTIVEKMRSMLDLRGTRHYVAFILTHQDADDLREAIGRISGRPPPPDERWRFEGVPVVSADIRASYAVEGWDQPLIHML